MVLWIGVDDTDSLRGMCTTFLATELIRELSSEYDLIGYPRLVRLNPNVPWKTRGNGAVCLRIGEGVGRPQHVGEIAERPVLSYARGRGDEDPASVLRRVASVVERWAVFDDPTTNPGVVILRRRPPAGLYWRAVRDIVPLEDVLEAFPDGSCWQGYKTGRGLIGAAAAVAWRPRDRTYELLAYRPPGAWGWPRRLDAASVRSMDEQFPSTFNNLDRETGHVAIAPHSPCPVLYGIRGDAAESLPKAQAVLRGEAPERWVLFETNQGTDDQVRWDDWSLVPGASTSVEGEIRGRARTVPGGHTFVPFGGKSEVDLAFYEPSKEFRRVARALRPGDRLRAWGSVRADRRSLNVEKLLLQTLAPDRIRIANPVCPACGKSMKSAGKGQGYRCLHGHGTAPPGSGSFVTIPRAIDVGWHEPPVYARRHLTMPVRRILSRKVRLAGRGQVGALAQGAGSTASEPVPQSLAPESASFSPDT